jgi:hypothetical protein
MRSTPSPRNCSERTNPDLFHFPLGNFLTSPVIIVSSVSANRLRANTIGSLLRDRFLSALAKNRGDLDWSALALGASDDAGLTT